MKKRRFCLNRLGAFSSLRCRGSTAFSRPLSLPVVLPFYIAVMHAVIWRVRRAHRRVLCCAAMSLPAFAKEYKANFNSAATPEEIKAEYEKEQARIKAEYEKEQARIEADRQHELKKLALQKGASISFVPRHDCTVRLHSSALSLCADSRGSICCSPLVS